MFAIASRCFAHVWLSSAFCLYISQSCGFLYLFPLARAFSHNWFAKTYIKHIFRQFVAGLSYIHSQGISHRDIKPENIVLTSDHQAKIIDFGLSEQSRYVCFSLSNLKTY